MPLNDLTNSPLDRPASRTSARCKQIASAKRVGSSADDRDNNACHEEVLTACARDAAVDEAIRTKMPKTTSSGSTKSVPFQSATAYPKGCSMTTMLERYKEWPIVGSGTFGLVVMIVNKNTGLDYVAKRVRWIDDKVPRDEKGDVVPPEEYRLLRYLPSHPNIIRAFEWYYGKKHAFMVLEPFGPNWEPVAETGSWMRTDIPILQPSDLYGYLNEVTRPTLSERDFQKIASQLVKAVHHLAKHHIVHRDLKAENILINDSLQIKLVDFGLATTALPDEWRTELVGTVEAWPPEMTSGRSYQGHHLAAAEVYMLGGILLELCQRQGARHRFNEEHVRDVVQNPYARPSEQWTMTGWDDWCDLILSCLHNDPKLRPTIAELSEIDRVVHWDEGHWQWVPVKPVYPFYTPRHLRATTQRLQTKST